MKMYNASLEHFKITCEAKRFEFKPRDFTVVPDNLTGIIYEQVKPWGVFPVPEGLSKNRLQELKYQALKDYLKGALRVRIECYLMQKDHYAKIGVTLPEPSEFTKALQWKKEIHKLLELESPIEVIPSFLDEDTRKKIGIDLPNVEFVKDKLDSIDQDLFNPKKIAEATAKKNFIQEADERKRGRQTKKESFLEPDDGKLETTAGD